MRYLDEYDFRARFVPSIFVTLPALFAAFAVLPSLRSLVGVIVGSSLDAVLALILARIARDEGKKIEPDLIREWDGMPTTRFLRHRNSEVETPTRDRYKASLSKLSGAKFPTVAQEAADPAGADAIYASAVAKLRELRRGKDHRLVFGENCNYGMMRNLFALRTLGIGISVFCAVVSAGGLFLPTTSVEMAIVALIVCVLVGLVLARFMTKSAVKRTAEAYATALLGSSLGGSSISKK